MSKAHWILYDPNNKLQTEQMSETDMQFSLMKMKASELEHFLIWKSEWDKWQKLNEFLKSDASPFIVNFMAKTGQKQEDPAAPSSLKMKTANAETIKKVQTSFSNVQVSEVSLEDVFSVGQQQFDAEQIGDAAEKSDVNFKALNKKTAFSKSRLKDDMQKIEILLTTLKGQMFRSTAQNISLTGTFSEKAVPSDFHNGIFNLVVINNLMQNEVHKRISLQGKIIITDASMYVQFVNLTDVQKHSLKSLLDAYVHEQRKLSA